VEVKHRSPNDKKTVNYPGWTTYLAGTDAFIDADSARRSGHYELARNWRLAWELANGRPFTLINLGPQRLFEREEADRLNTFEASLRQTADRRFLRMTWDHVLTRAEEMPEWFKGYVSKKALVRSEIGAERNNVRQSTSLREGP
jgi:hypothetical protein